MSILVVGSVAYDTIRTPTGEVQDALGGSATYFSAAASFFAPVKIIAAIGDDFSREQLSFLGERGTDLDGLHMMPGKTFRWTGVYNENMNERQTVCTELNVFERFQPHLSEGETHTPLLFLANIDPDLQNRILDQVQGARLIMSNTIHLWIEKKRETFLSTLDRVTVLMINDSEARALTGEYNLLKAGRRILLFGPKAVLITKGDNGVLMVMKDSVFTLPAYPKEEVCDPTGAGDSFAGGFMGYAAQASALNEMTYRTAAVYGSIMASFTIEAFGVERLRDLTRQEIEKRYREFVEITRFQGG
ncbi:MAG: sugar kinase [Gemmatimonadota bacterium]|nr:MAG: sugar kinase [Gemmatimonadota bacterium]